MAFILCYTPLRISSKSGHVALLTASREPQHIPEDLVPDAVLQGCVRCNEEGHVLVTGTPVVVRAVGAAPEKRDPPADLPVREQAITAAVKTVIESPSPTEITTTGIPRVFAISERCGFKVSQSEVLAALKQLGF